MFTSRLEGPAFSLLFLHLCASPVRVYMLPQFEHVGHGYEESIGQSAWGEGN